MSKEKVFPMVGAVTGKIEEPKHVQTLGTDDKLESSERSV